MKLLDYYLAAFSPFLIVILLLKLEFSFPFLISLVLYYIYRCFLDFYKLKTNGIVNKSKIWQFIIPIWTFLYFRQLYFE